MNEELRRLLEERFELGELLGRGSSGEVWKARRKVRNDNNETLVSLDEALKVSHERLDEGSPAIESELRGLNDTHSLCIHPHIIGLRDVEIKLGYLITHWELADQCLAKRLDECRQEGLPGVPDLKLAKYMNEAADGIDFLNKNGVYHCDIKPANLLLCYDSVKLGDLGWAKFIGDARRSKPSRTTVFTEGYAPPEVYNHEESPSRDLYGLAATFIRLYTGREPFGDKPEDIRERQRNGEPELEGLDARRARLVRVALHPEPDNRPGDGAVAWVGRLFKDRMTPEPPPPIVQPDLKETQGPPLPPLKDSPTIWVCIKRFFGGK